jgi:hypothetical protein
MTDVSTGSTKPNRKFEMSCRNKIWRIERDGFIWFETGSRRDARIAHQILSADETDTDRLNLLDNNW